MVTLTHDDKFTRRFRIQAAGDVIDQGSKLDTGLGNLLTVESHLRITTEELGAANQIEVRVKTLNETSFTTLATITGNETKVLGIESYEIVHFVVTNYDGSAGYLGVTGFVKNAPPASANSVQICDANNNCAELIDIGGNYALPVVPTISTTAPTIYNITIGGGDVGVEQSQVLLNGTKKVLIKHRTSGTIDFSFTSGLSSYIEIPKGTTYAESDLNLQGSTLYFRSDKTGVIEILTWT